MMESLYKELCEMYKSLNVLESNAEESLSNQIYQNFINYVTLRFACKQWELDKNPIVAALLAKYKEDVKIMVGKDLTVSMDIQE